MYFAGRYVSPRLHRLKDGDQVYYREKYGTVFRASEAWGDFYDKVSLIDVRQATVPIRRYVEERDLRPPLGCTDEEFKAAGGEWLANNPFGGNHNGLGRLSD